MEPSERIKALRTEKDLSTRALADSLGVAASVVSNWETGLSGIRKPNAMALQLLYGVSWQWLMTGEGPMWVAPSSPPGTAPPSERPPIDDATRLSLMAVAAQLTPRLERPEETLTAYQTLLAGVEALWNKR